MNWPGKKWKCPNCDKDHAKPHFAFRNQIDLSKKLGAEGRVKFNREGSDMDCGQKKSDTKIQTGLPSTGPAVVKGIPQGLFCPHCGWVQKVIPIKLTKVKKVIQSGFAEIKKGIKGFFKIGKNQKCICGKPATYSNVNDVGLCDEHYTSICT